MRELVTDSHALLWHLYVPARVGLQAREALMAPVDEETLRRVLREELRAVG